MAGRIARIDEYPQLKETLADALVEGVSFKALAEEPQWHDIFQVSDRNTIATWARREEIQAMVATKIRNRANRVLAKVDTKILARLDSGGDIPTETLLKIRQQFAGSTVNVNQGDPAKALEELFLAAHDDEALATAVSRLRGKGDDPEDDLTEAD